MSDPQYSEQVLTFSKASSLPELPSVIDVIAQTPPNPPEETQMKFVGLAYETAYEEAETFVKVVDEFAAKHSLGPLSSLARIIDFGSGWGRISRTLLTKITPKTLHAIDVDNDMTALINLSLPGINALTIDPEPPTVLGTASAQGLLAFSVFSHLSGGAHEAWAHEIGRLIAPGGFAAITVLDEAFFGQVEGAQAAVRAGEADDFAASLATTFPDVGQARDGYRAGKIQYAGIGGGEMRTGDYYGWTAAPPAYVERVWGAAGFRVVEWVPSNVLFAQAFVFLVRTDDPVTGDPGSDRLADSARHTYALARRSAGVRGRQLLRRIRDARSR